MLIAILSLTYMMIIMLYTVSYLYENRNGADYHKLTLMLRALLFAQREGVI